MPPHSPWSDYLITDPWFYALAVPALLITGISKGGFASGGGNLSVPAMALLIPAPQAAAIALPILCAMDIAGLRAWWGRWNRREMRVILPGGLFGILIGAFAFGVMTDQAIKLMVGGIALAFLARSLWLGRHGASPAPAAHSAARGGFWSAVSGFTSTIAHAGGPPLAVYLYPLRMERAQLAATTVVFFGTVNYVKLLPYALLGQLSLSNLLTSLVLLPLAPVGVRLGVWMQRRISDRLFYRVIYVLLGATGLKLVADGLGL
ncbi:sulfite exporter TauE/SafE family protein [Teichococcus oryzae]|uniref:sulfite exporter TauE/SafE family protein n=1 Tax=Teichococcus oryzae TaxID=1608942 RepID=UPI001F4FD52B|nr:sulfite exporter TauE/SafE family protein [Pseudoroseomonas oryzae]